MVSVSVVSDLCSAVKELSNDITLNELAQKLYSITGILPDEMRLNVTLGFNSPEFVVDKLSEQPNLKLFETFNGKVATIEVLDTSSNSIVRELKTLEDNDEVEGFKLTEEEYAKRNDSVLQWKKQNKLGKFDSNYKRKMDENKTEESAKLLELQLNQRCSVKSPGSTERRGWLRFVGKIPEIHNEDIWCGVEFDEPLGKNDGTVKGKRYFGPVKQNYGGIIKPRYVTTGKGFTPFKIDEESSEDEI